MKISGFKTGSSQCDGHVVKRSQTYLRLHLSTPQHFDEKQGPVTLSVLHHATTVVHQRVSVILIKPEQLQQLRRRSLYNKRTSANHQSIYIQLQ